MLQKLTEKKYKCVLKFHTFLIKLYIKMIATHVYITPHIAKNTPGGFTHK
jgi:hypothetical protein